MAHGHHIALPNPPGGVPLRDVSLFARRRKLFGPQTQSATCNRDCKAQFKKRPETQPSAQDLSDGAFDGNWEIDWDATWCRNPRGRSLGW